MGIFNRAWMQMLLSEQFVPFLNQPTHLDARVNSEPLLNI